MKRWIAFGVVGAAAIAAIVAIVLGRSEGAATAPQTGMTVKARRKNLRGAFALRDDGVVRNRRVALVDDVMTTGSTVQAAAQCLRAAGAKEVEIGVIARA